MAEAIYTRQSIDKKDSVSIETQTALCLRYAEGEPALFQDRGFSGKNTNRPAFHRLMEAVEAGQISKIIVYRLDRFSRSIADFGQVWNILDRHGVEFQSVTENFDTSSPVGCAMLNIILVFAQLERETIAERVRDNYQHRFSLGAWPGGPAPYGYSLAKRTDSAGRSVSSLAVNDCAAVVRDIFERYARDGVSLRGIAKEMNGKGIPGPRRKSWDSIALSRILHSPLYVQATQDVYWWYLAKGLEPKQELEAFDGAHACNIIGKRARAKGKYQNAKQQCFSLSNHQGFIPAELWLRCQEKLEQNRQLASVTAGKHSWLTGLLKCGQCGYAVKITRDGSSGKRYLSCSGRANMAVCSGKISVSLDGLELAVSEKMCQLLDQCPEVKINPAQNSAAEEVLRIDARIDRLVRALAESSTVSIPYINVQIQSLHRQREQWMAQLGTGAGQNGQRMRVDFERAGFEEKKLVARAFIEKILLKDDAADVIWNL